MLIRKIHDVQPKPFLWVVAEMVNGQLVMELDPADRRPLGFVSMASAIAWQQVNGLRGMRIAMLPREKFFSLGGKVAV